MKIRKGMVKLVLLSFVIVSWLFLPNAFADDFSVAGGVMNVHNPDGSFSTLLTIDIGDDFSGILPDDIGSITVTGPSGILPISKDDFTYTPRWREFFIAVDGSPEIGEYTFTVMSGALIGTDTDTQSVIRNIPVPDTDTLSPAEGEVLTSMTPTFSWGAVTHPETTVYYRLTINDLSGWRVFATGRQEGMLSYTLPAGILNPGETYTWRVRVTDSSDWLEVQNRSNSEWITFTMAGTLMHNAVPGIDLQYNAWGVNTWTSDADDPFTGISHSVKVVDYDGIASDGSSHTVTVTYPNGGPTKTLWFNYKMDNSTASYSMWDGDIDQPINIGQYSGAYVYEVEDPDGNWSEATDNLVVDTLDPPDETTFSPGYDAPQSIIAHFDDVYVNGVIYDDFQSGFDPDKWESQPPEVTYENGEVRFERTWNTESGSPRMKLVGPDGIKEIKATVRVGSISGDNPYARIGGTFCHDSVGEVTARVGIRGDEAVYVVYREWWEGNHYISKRLVPMTTLGPVTQGAN